MRWVRDTDRSSRGTVKVMGRGCDLRWLRGEPTCSGGGDRPVKLTFSHRYRGAPREGRRRLASGSDAYRLIDWRAGLLAGRHKRARGAG